MILIEIVIFGVLIGCIFAFVSLGISYIWGLMGFVHFAYGDFIMMAAYLAFWAMELYYIDPLISVFFNAPIFFVIGILYYKYIIKRLIHSPRTIQLFATFGTKYLLVYLAQMLWTPNIRGVHGEYLEGAIELFGIRVGKASFVCAIVAFIAATILAYVVKYTKIGKAMRATTQDSEGALSLGVDIDKIYVLAWGISGLIAGLAGSLLINIYSVTPYFGESFMLIAFTTVTLGGIGSIIGSLIGGLVIGIETTFFGYYYIPALKYTTAYIAFVLILFIKPEGLFGVRPKE